MSDLPKPRQGCAECRELKRHFIAASSDHSQLLARTKGRRASAPERRRLIRLRTNMHVAQQLLENHRAVCEEAL